MAKVAVVTDSCAGMPPELAAANDIHIIPVRVNWHGRTFRDGIDITPSELYRRMRQDATLPTTSVPPPSDFLQLYTNLGQRDEVKGIVSVHLSYKLSFTYGVAQMASKKLEGLVPIRVIDSDTASMAQGFSALVAARAAAEGASLEEVAQEAERVARKAHLYAMLETLEYLYRGGRVGKAAALLGIALKFKPVLTVKEGEVNVLARPRTRAKGMQIMLREMQSQVGEHPVHVAVMHADALEQAEGLREEVASRFHCLELYTTEFTPVMGTHSGPGVVGLSFYADDG